MDLHKWLMCSLTCLFNYRNEETLGCLCNSSLVILLRLTLSSQSPRGTADIAVDTVKTYCGVKTAVLKLTCSLSEYMCNKGLNYQESYNVLQIKPPVCRGMSRRSGCLSQVGYLEKKVTELESDSLANNDLKSKLKQENTHLVHR